MHGRVAQSWLAAVAELGGVATAAADELEQRYRQPHRRYHTLAHIEAVLNDCTLLGAEVGLDSGQCAVVALAACAHDVVYDGRPGADERASAEWARARLADAGVAAGVGDRVGALVLATAAHDGYPDDAECGVLLDADLAILGADAPTYADYVAAVRAEYAGVADDVWRAGRAAVLGSLLGRPTVYVTEPARLKWDARARHNLATELAALQG
jgi:predicted metal-dependent HD superfamily phosphohydrolase